MKKLAILAIFALSLFASGTTSKSDVPIPECNPCGSVR
jgi:hypothetical protein